MGHTAGINYPVRSDFDKPVSNSVLLLVVRIPGRKDAKAESVGR